MNSPVRKSIGAFYTPEILADLLSKRMIHISSKKKLRELNVLDPATGESSLLKSFVNNIKVRKNIHTNILGIDIDSEALNVSKKMLMGLDNNIKFIHTDALYPLGKGHIEGWTNIKSKYLPNGINFIISNPPWGADISKYHNLRSDFEVAKGQFDIYDLFIDTILDNLTEGGIYGIIVPDSIYNHEHNIVREKLLKQTVIYYIYRLGESFFEGVNVSISIIIGVKGKAKKNHKVSCFHLNTVDRSKATVDLYYLDKLSKEKCNRIKQSDMVRSDYSFLLDIDDNDSQLFAHFNDASKHLGDYVIIDRGVELSKKGEIVKCPICGKWMPIPKKNADGSFKCAICHKKISTNKCVIETRNIISKEPSDNSVGLLVGEDISRYKTTVSKYLCLGYNGINYKRQDIYNGPKILVRKTGVGITAGLDYSDSFSNQVVYIVRLNNNSPDYITIEFILAILCSRAITYFFIKKYGSTEWRSHPYLTQKILRDLPFPEVSNLHKEIIQEITRSVQDICANHIEGRLDCRIESLVAKIWKLDKTAYKNIFDTIRNVQLMIPFKRLLNFSEEDMQWDIDI
ncbi:MAG: N-6 DNA methylase [Prevotella sp.]|jgi:predicted RNA methylase/DNA-directed RNA polymerase subunit M/transcription elongation factor TFIIS|nr:N-6 DNA methylase [Prevotella sp.]